MIRSHGSKQNPKKKLLLRRVPGAVSDQKAAVESHLCGINAPPEPFLGCFEAAFPTAHPGAVKQNKGPYKGY